MNPTELAVLLPSHSLDDFPLYHTGVEADNLLSAVTALWHPALLAAVGDLPTWHRADTPPEEVQGRVLTIPLVSESLVERDWLDRARQQQAVIVVGEGERADFIQQIFAQLSATGEQTIPEVDAELTADFLALGFAYLHMNLLCRRMRYVTGVDEVLFTRDCLAAASAAVAGDMETARAKLLSCCEALTEARERFYPIDAYLVDLTLLAEGTLGPELREELNTERPQNLLLSGEVLELLAEQEPETLSLIQQRLAAGTLSIVGGEYREEELPLLPPEDVLRNFQRGEQVYERHLGRRVNIFGRRRHGLSPLLPQLLSRLDFIGALHFTLDIGAFPRGEQSKLRWEGIDGHAVDCLARVPLDANEAETFLGFSERLSEAMDLDHVATLPLAHWPGHSSPWYEDLRRISAYAPIFGMFVTLDDYFRTTDAPGRISRFEPDRYRAPYLREATEAQAKDSVSRCLHRHREAAQRTTAEALSTLCAVTGLETDTTTDSAETTAVTLARAFAESLPRTPDGQSGTVSVNPGLSSVLCEVTDEKSAGQRDATSEQAVQVPPFGYKWTPSDVARPAEPTRGLFRRPRVRPPVAADNVLANADLRVVIDEESGGIRALYRQGVRGNRASQRLAVRRIQQGSGAVPRWRDPDQLATYSRMVADAIETTASDTEVGRIESRGRLVDDNDAPLARFVQQVSLWRGLPRVEIEIELSLEQPLAGDPWHNYVASRWAWADGGAEVFRNLGLSLHTTTAKRIESPLVVDVRTEIAGTTLFCGGLPYHRLVDSHVLDTLLITPGESERHFRLAMVLDHPQPLAGALQWLQPPLHVAGLRDTPTPAESWLMAADSRNVVPTHWEPVREGEQVVGFRVRLLETAGRSGPVRLRCFRPLAAARQLDFRGQSLVELKLEADSILLDCTAHEWLQIEARFQV